MSGTLSWLHTANARLSTLDGRRVVFRGVCAPEWPPDGADERTLDAAVRDVTDRVLYWTAAGADLLRIDIPTAIEDRAPATKSASRYFDAIDRVISNCSAAGAYTALGLDLTARAEPAGSAVQDDVRLLLQLGERYSAEPAVLFEVAAPTPPATVSGVARAEAWFEWTSRVRAVVALLREVHPRATTLVSVPLAALDDLRSSGTPLVDDVPPGVVFAVQVDVRDRGAVARTIELARRIPILVQGRVSDEDCHLAGLIVPLLTTSGTGWIAAPTFAPTSHDDGLLVRRRGRLESTRAGRAVQRSLALSSVWAPTIDTSRAPPSAAGRDFLGQHRPIHEGGTR